MNPFMNFPTILGMVAGVLQLAAAVYALRLIRLFGESRVGWSMFCAFLILALIQLVQSITPFDLGAPPGIPIEAMYALVSLLLFTGMVHLETMLEERLDLERKERQLRNELESEVKKQTVYLTRVIEELKSEMESLKRTEPPVAPAPVEQVEPPIIASTAKTAVNGAKTEEASSIVLHNIDEMLKSVKATESIVTSPAKQTNIANVVNVGMLIREHSDDLGAFMARDPRGKKLPQYIAKLAKHLAKEQTALSQELESLKKNLEKIMALQRRSAKIDWEEDAVEAAGSASS